MFDWGKVKGWDKIKISIEIKKEGSIIEGDGEKLKPDIFDWGKIKRWDKK